MKRTLLTIALAWCAAATPAAAGEPVPAPADAPAWNWSSSLDALWIGNVAGGRHTGGVYNSWGGAAIEADLGELANGSWRGATAQVSALWIRGGSVSSQYAGDALVASNIDGFDSIRLFEVWVEQRFARDRASLRVGAMAADEEFAGNEAGGALSNAGFAWPAFAGGNLPGAGPVGPTAGLGVRLAVEPAEGWRAQVGVYDGDTVDDPDGSPVLNQHGTHWQLDANQGAFVIAEATRSLPARSTTLRAGGWWHSATFEDVRRDASGESFAISGGDPREHRGTWGVYAGASSRLWSKGDDGPAVTGWLRAGFAPADRSDLAWAVDGGAEWSGPWPGRGEDVFAVGVVHAAKSADVIAAASDEQFVSGSTAALPDFERVIECTYKAKVHPRVSVGPDLQWIQHPGFSSERRDAWVVGLRVGIE